MKAPCPSCQEAGNDRSGDNLHVYEDGHAHCFRCDYHVHKYEEGASYTASPKGVIHGVNITEARSLPVRALRHKPISKEVCERYGVRVGYGDDGSINEVYYPYTSKGNVVAYKVRTVPKEFTWIGEVKDASLFGMNTVSTKGRFLIITEGEDDCLAVSQMLQEKGKNYNVVSLPNGANEKGTVDKKLKSSIDFLSNFETVLIAFDMDDPGQATAKAVAHWLAPFTEVRLLDLPRKDSADMLINGESDIWWDCFYKSKEYKPDDVVCSSDLSLDDLRKPLTEGYDLPFPFLQNKLRGLRKRELSLLTAGSGVGKTTFTREICYHLATKHNLRLAHIFLEEAVEKTALSYAAIHNDIPLPMLRINPSLVDDEGWQSYKKQFLDPGQLFFTDHFGSLESSVLIDKCRYFVHACEVDFIMLDHISMVISGQESSNERKDIDVLMTNLAAFVNETGVGVIAIVHLRRAQSGSFNEGKEISLSDLRGSGGLEQLSWNVIALERNQQDPDNKDQAQIRLLKNREWGSLGLCDTLIYSQDTGRLLPLNTEEF